MTALEAIATYLPPARLAVEEVADELRLSTMQVRLLRRYQGFAQVYRDPGRTLVDLLLGAADQLDALRGREGEVRYVIHARTFPVVAPYPVNPVHEVCRRLGLDGAVAFTVAHHSCATGLLAIDVAGRLLAGDPSPDALALVLAGEKTFTRDAQVYPGVSMFSEGAAACLVRRGGDRDVLLAYATSLHGKEDLELPECAAAFEREYPGALAGVMCAAVAQAGLGLDDIELILPHNVNLVCWQRACRRIGVPIERVLLDNIAAIGHAFCADAFLNHRTARERGLLRPGAHYLVAAAGAAHGAMFSAMVFRH